MSVSINNSGGTVNQGTVTQQKAPAFFYTGQKYTYLFHKVCGCDPLPKRPRQNQRFPTIQITTNVQVFTCPVTVNSTTNHFHFDSCRQSLKTKRICKFYPNCRWGPKCKFAHIIETSGRDWEVCKNFQKGLCSKGKFCSKLHLSA